MQENTFKETISAGYNFAGESIILGGAMYKGQVQADTFVKLSLKTLNRHGLIAGATGTGKTKTLQAIAENLSDNGIPTLLMDLKGDLSGIAAQGQEKSFIIERHQKMNLPFTPKSFPVELMSISEQDGVRLRSTVSEFGSVLLSRIMELSDVQEGVMAVIFKYCDDHHLPLLDLKDLKKMLQYITDQGKEEIEQHYGRISTASTSAILRKIVELENQGAELFFGERSFEVEDLLRKDTNARGYVNIIRLTDIQDRPKMFSTFMLSLLAEIYNTFPEQGDSDKPKLVIFIDEAHLIFSQASKTLLSQLENIVKLIRSKGVGLIFCTQTPTDIPDSILSQLGMKIQHSLRAFTAKDRQAIKLTAQNYPTSPFYNVAEELTNLGTGEAFITLLDPKGKPTPLAATMMRAPQSRMDILSEEEIRQLLHNSTLKPKYQQVIDRESAYEIINAKVERLKSEQNSAKPSKVNTNSTSKNNSKTALNPVLKVVTSATFIRGVFGVLSKVLKK